MNVLIQYDGGGCHVLWYRDDDGGSGYGGNPEECRWYGSRADCEARAKQPPPKGGWVPVGLEHGAPPYDAATATGMYDRL